MFNLLILNFILHVIEFAKILIKIDILEFIYKKIKVREESQVVHAIILTHPAFDTKRQ